jgi:hypothetical protein
MEQQIVRYKFSLQLIRNVLVLLFSSRSTTLLCSRFDKVRLVVVVAVGDLTAVVVEPQEVMRQ